MLFRDGKMFFKNVSGANPNAPIFMYDMERFNIDIKMYLKRNGMKLKEVMLFNDYNYSHYQVLCRPQCTSLTRIKEYQERLDQLNIPLKFEDYFIGIRATQEQLKQYEICKKYNQNIIQYKQDVEYYTSNEQTGLARDYEKIIQDTKDLVINVLGIPEMIYSCFDNFTN